MRDAPKRKFVKEVAEALLLVTGASELSAEVAQALLGGDGPGGAMTPDAFADASAAVDDAVVLQRALTSGMADPDPPIQIESFLEATNKALPDLVAMQVQRALAKAGGIGAKTCAVSACAPLLRDVALKVTHATFVKDIFKAFRGAPPKKAPPPPPPGGLARSVSNLAAATSGASDASAVSGGATRKVFGKKSAPAGEGGDAPQSSAAPAAAATAPAADADASGTPTRRTFGTKREPTAAEASAAPSPSESGVMAPATSSNDAASSETSGATKKTFFKKKTTGDAPAPGGVAAAPTSSENPTPRSSSPVAPPTIEVDRAPPANAAEDASVGITRTFSRRTASVPPAEPIPVPPAHTPAPSGDGPDGEAAVVAPRKVFTKKKALDAPEAAPVRAPSRATTPERRAEEAPRSGPSVAAVARAFGPARGNSPPLDDSAHAPAAPAAPAATSAPATRGGPAPNVLTATPTVVSEVSATGAVIVPRAPEAALWHGRRMADAQCQTDWGARFVTAREAIDSTPEGRAAALLRGDIAAAVEEAHNKANQLLAMKRQFVDARMRSLADAEAAILSSLPAADRERLTLLQVASAQAPLSLATYGGGAPVVDHARVARAAMAANPALRPDDDDAYARARETAERRLRQLAQEEALVVRELAALEQRRGSDIAAAARGHALLRSAASAGSPPPPSAGPGFSPTFASLWASGPSASVASSAGSPSKKVRRW